MPLLNNLSTALHHRASLRSNRTIDFGIFPKTNPDWVYIYIYDIYGDRIVSPPLCGTDIITCAEEMIFWLVKQGGNFFRRTSLYAQNFDYYVIYTKENTRSIDSGYYARQNDNGQLSYKNYVNIYKYVFLFCYYYTVNKYWHITKSFRDRNSFRTRISLNYFRTSL